MKLSEIDAKIAELQSQRAKALAEEREAEMAKNFDEAREIITNLAPTLQKLFDMGYCPPRLKEALTDATGKFNPGMYIKRPKGPREV
ncbi:MAG: hypothetical protein EOQ39_19005 [Mesorhizobium sp.]|uniref:hypothetical protein n=1 Tax=Mesorhizobium sp. TaxID=1871066 RepID=UPI000FE5029B|nr:hypothetical protein [Mesorhizobium sp.]RWB08738.1 MAG: hypothetical protein EOQ37_04330 [Mesorhizobium sp.]RWB13609.1 MAG: hypothetical protein EOQ39_19005 [Mesorhizobium sp.]